MDIYIIFLLQKCLHLRFGCLIFIFCFILLKEKKKNISFYPQSFKFKKKKNIFILKWIELK